MATEFLSQRSTAASDLLAAYLRAFIASTLCRTRRDQRLDLER